MFPPSTDGKITCSACGNVFNSGEKQKINKTKVLIVEGRDDQRFLMHACSKFRGDDDVQIIIAEGKGNIPKALKTVIFLEHFDRVKTLVVAQDADGDPASATQSIQRALEKADLPVPPEPFAFACGETVRTGFMLFPGPKEKGMLEDLCLKTIGPNPLIGCVDAFLLCAINKGSQKTSNSKKRLYAFLAGADKFVGLRIGEATCRGAWDLEHEAMKPFRQMIEKM